MIWVTRSSAIYCFLTHSRRDRLKIPSVSVSSVRVYPWPRLPHSEADFCVACAIHADQFQTVVEQARKLINGHQFNNEPIRVLISSLGSGLRATDAFLASTLSKHLLRETRLADAAVNNPDALRFNTAQRRYGLPGSVKADPDEAPDEDEDVESSAVAELERSKLPTKPNPLNVAVYGQILLAAKSYQSALCEYAP